MVINHIGGHVTLPRILSTFCCAGEDVGHYGGSYKVTYDLHKKYGDLRLLDTPICGMFSDVSGTVARAPAQCGLIFSQLVSLADTPHTLKELKLCSASVQKMDSWEWELGLP